MRYLTDSVKFAVRNWRLMIPLFAVLTISLFIQGSGTTAGLSALAELANPDDYENTGILIRTVADFLAAVTSGGYVLLAARLIYYPLTFGLVNKGIKVGHASLSDTGAVIKENLVRSVVHLVCESVVYAVIGLVSVTLLMFLKREGYLLFMIFVTLTLILTSLWFPAMVADGLDVFSAFRKSVRVVGSSFWIICGINFVVGLASIFAASVAGAVAGIISGILGLPGSSPVISTIITSFLTIVGAAVISARQFVLATARLMIYREKTGNGQ